MQPNSLFSQPDGVWSAARVPGRFGWAQLIAVEAALLAAGTAVLGHNLVATLATGVVAVVLLVLALARSGGRWLYQSLAARRRLSRRRHQVRAALQATDDPVLAVAPGLRIRTVTDRGVAFGVGQDPAGWFAALGVLSWIGPAADRPPSLSLDRIAGLLTEAVTTISAVQVVKHHAAAVPETGTAANDLVWLALRLGSRDAVDAAASRGGGLDGVDRALAAGVGRVGTILSGADVPYELLDASAVHHALTVSCGLYRPGGRGSTGLDERWRLWSAAGLVHVCFAVRGWPARPDPDLLDHLVAVPAAATDTAILVAPHGSDAVSRVLVRVSAAPASIAESLRRLRENARRLGVRLDRTDGDHGTGVYATAPTAWTPVSPSPSAWAAATPAPDGWTPLIAAPRARPPVISPAGAWQPPILGPGGPARPTPATPTLPTVTMPKTR